MSEMEIICTGAMTVAEDPPKTLLEAAERALDRALVELDVAMVRVKGAHERLQMVRNAKMSVPATADPSGLDLPDME